MGFEMWPGVYQHGRKRQGVSCLKTIDAKGDSSVFEKQDPAADSEMIEDKAFRRILGMPIYEFYCARCHMIFNFFSKSVNTERRPDCPRCHHPELERYLSVFASPRKRDEGQEGTPMPNLDETEMEKAMGVLEREFAHVDDDDPRQAANLMRKLTDMTGLKLGPTMEEALKRMEAGEDPEQVEAEMGDLMEGEEPFLFQEGTRAGCGRRPPLRDEKLYDL
jgi:putative FmdB family regulatory protein